MLGYTELGAEYWVSTVQGTECWVRTESGAECWVCAQSEYEGLGCVVVLAQDPITVNDKALAAVPTQDKITVNGKAPIVVLYLGSNHS